MMKKLISGVERAAYEAGFGGDHGCVIKTAQEATALFVTIEKYFPNGSKGHKCGMAWKTIYNQWLKAGFQLKGIDDI
jgi:hypothetical protein